MPDWLSPEQRSRNMAAIRSKGTKTEDRLGALLREMFPRRKIIRHPEDLVGKPDFLVPSLALAAFADGCFWHGCPRHGRIPDDNPDYWVPKLERNKARDRRVSRELRAQGLLVVRIWDHDLKPSVAPARTKIRRVLRTSA